MENRIRILKKDFVTHDVKRFIVEKPEGYKIEEGQAAEISITRQGWNQKKRKFSFTSTDDDLVLEFMIKEYLEREGVTKKLHDLSPGDELEIGEPFDSIKFRGPGVFIAGGAGITPFLAILRKIHSEGKIKGNTLLFSNKTQKDIICEKELREMLGAKAVFTLTQEKKEGYENKRIGKEFLKEKIKDFKQNFYVCGPPIMVREIRKELKELGADSSFLIL